MQKQKLYRVVTFLGREEMEFLDKLARDLYFSFCVNVPRSKLIEMMIKFTMNGYGQKQETSKEMGDLEKNILNCLKPNSNGVSLTTKDICFGNNEKTTNNLKS